GPGGTRGGRRPGWARRRSRRSGGGEWWRTWLVAACDPFRLRAGHAAAAGAGVGSGDGVERRANVGCQSISVVRELDDEGQVEGVEQDEQGEVRGRLVEPQLAALLRLVEALGDEAREVGQVHAQGGEHVGLAGFGRLAGGLRSLAVVLEVLERGAQRQ